MKLNKDNPGIVPGFCLFPARLQHSSDANGEFKNDEIE
nr:MAG TPA_asm: hypothetical protein [Caudoviricetes sp.]